MADEGLDEPVIAYVAIHGIGSQRYGETAEAVAEAIAAACSAVGATFIEQEGDSAFHVATRSGRLTTTDGAAQLQFVDGWWDGEVTPPPLGRVLRWMLRVTPFIVLLTIASWFSDLSEASRAFERRRRVPMELLCIPYLLVALLLTPLLMLALFIVNVVTVRCPNIWPRLTNLVLSVFGDAWLYRSDRLDQVVIPRLKQVVERARSSADVVILVGHSQGAEIGRRLALDVSVDACVWVGGAITQLAVTRTLRSSPVLPYLLWAYVLLSPLFVSAITAGVLQNLVRFLLEMRDLSLPLWSVAHGDATAFDPVEGISDQLFVVSFADLPWVLLFAVFAVLAALVLRAFARRPADLGASPDCPVIEVKSLADPVCFGRMDAMSFTRHVPVRSGRAVFREHLSYFEKRETGIALLEPVLSSDGVPVPYEPRFGFWAQTFSVISTGILIAGAYVMGAAILGFLGW